MKCIIFHAIIIDDTIKKHNKLFDLAIKTEQSNQNKESSNIFHENFVSFFFFLSLLHLIIGRGLNYMKKVRGSRMIARIDTLLTFQPNYIVYICFGVG